MSDITGSKVTEITINANRFARMGKRNKQASTTVKKLKRFVQLQFNTKDPVYVSSDLNKKIWERGQNHSMNRIRIRVERGPCQVNPENKVVRLSLVDVSSFKNLKDIAVQEE